MNSTLDHGVLRASIALEAKEPKAEIFDAWASAPEGGSRRVSFSDEPPQALTFAVNGFENAEEPGEVWRPAPAPAPEAPRRRWQDFGEALEALEPVVPVVPVAEVPPLERRFSFSLTDLPEHLVRVGPGRQDVAPERRQEQKWNPLDGVKRHWTPSDVEWQQLGATTGLASHEHPKSLQIMGSLNEQQKAELRAQDLRKKITKLESALGGSPESGHVSIAAPPCRNGLGIVLSELTVSQVIDPLAQQAGWQVGDSILKVNGITILNSVQLSGELAKALSANRAVGRPMHFEVWRHPKDKAHSIHAQPSLLSHPAPNHPPHSQPHPTGPTYQHLGAHRAPYPSEPVTQWTGPKLVAPAEPPASCAVS